MKFVKRFFVWIMFLMIISFIFFAVSYSEAQSWEKVVADGFDNAKNDYAWSMATFKDKLYVGTLNSYGGAEIWCTSDAEATTWSKVHDDFLLSNRGIRCLYPDGDQALYACTFHPNGAQILRTTDGNDWKTVKRRGFGNRGNRSIRCMTRFGEYLYAGVGSNGAKLYRSKDGLDWEQVEASPSFLDTKIYNSRRRAVSINMMVGELAVFNDYLYAFTWVKDADYQNMWWFVNWVKEENEQDEEKFKIPEAPGAFEIWRTKNGINWEKVVGMDDAYGNGMGFSLHDPENEDNDIVTSVAVYEGHLYLGTGHDYGKTTVWRTSDGTSWEKVLDFNEEGEAYNYYVWRLWSFKNQLFVSTLNLGPAGNPGVTGGQIWVSPTGEKGSFDPCVHNGFDGEIINMTEDLDLPKNYGIRSVGILNDTLFIGTATVPSFLVTKPGRRLVKTIAAKDIGCEIWKMIPDKP